MAQLSRPYQIGLVAVALLAAAWLVLLQGHHSSPSESTSASAPTATTHSPSAAAQAHAQGSAGKATGHGSASSLGALGHDVEKARGAVATSKKNAQELQSKSSQASSQNPSSSSSSSHASTAAGAGATTHSAAPSTSATHAAPKSSAKGTVRAAVAVRQHAVEAQLAHGKTVLIFFWNPKGSDDRAVNKALGKLPKELNIAVDRARSNAVATFGTITRGVQVYGTPTLLVVNKKGEVKTLTGLQDPYTIASAIRESKKH